MHVIIRCNNAVLDTPRSWFHAHPFCSTPKYTNHRHNLRSSGHERPLCLRDEDAAVPLSHLTLSVPIHQCPLTMSPIIGEFTGVNMARSPLKHSIAMHSVIRVLSRINISILPSARSISTLDTAAIRALMYGSIWIGAFALAFLLTVFVLANVSASKSM